MKPVTPARRSYHHGDLRNALIAAGVELARDGGPEAVVLREVARRVGVSPNAAYRHFADLPELMQAIAVEALKLLAASMQAAIDAARPAGDDVERAWRFMRAVGRGYVDFALAEPGLFRTAFGHEGAVDEDVVGTDWVSPSDIVLRGLAGLVDTGLLPADEVESAQLLAWSSVHGLSLLLLGPLADLSPAEREEVIESTLDQVGKGLLPGDVAAAASHARPATARSRVSSTGRRPTSRSRR